MVLPSFSIVLETENLANADLEGLTKSLASLAHQDLSPNCANEVWLIESGDTPLDLLDRLCKQYPWIKIHQAPLDTGYYKAKMLGAELATGEVVVYFDSDCIYEPQWLRMLLETFSEHEEVQIVAGETMTRGVGIYGTAMAIAYIFPPFSGQTSPSKTRQYFLNNVAFRRDFLLQHPIPLDLPLYRGNCDIHARNLIREGYVLWKQPRARATHAPPSSLSHFFWRFLLIGHDYYWQTRLAAQKNLRSEESLKGANGKLQIFRDRFAKMIAEDSRHLIYFPLAIPVALSSAVLVAIGYFITAWKPHLLLATYEQILID
ncbi:glycosyltransferase family 2 protein [Oscillatoria sp. FACHB-1406]|uniref:glycosyltransferase n=1 Tax=Oscillatoria sp. FACHB-1406 TaxID=2692846 RepID=UPI001688732F|nr:glycosyltransferase family 2 protein [Oscillatoria sp. FACHB-1406]MBD2578922.1 glycosyltransferase family 2 protein [Oscillatoria sp. FACHB-1406]